MIYPVRIRQIYTCQGVCRAQGSRVFFTRPCQHPRNPYGVLRRLGGMHAPEYTSSVREGSRYARAPYNSEINISVGHLPPRVSSQRASDVVRLKWDIPPPYGWKLVVRVRWKSRLFARVLTPIRSVIYPIELCGVISKREIPTKNKISRRNCGVSGSQCLWYLQITLSYLESARIARSASLLHSLAELKSGST